MILIGVDGGASHCRAVALHVESGMVGVGEAPGCNPVYVDFGEAARRALAAAREALSAIKASRGDAIAAGFAGLDSQRLLAEARRSMSEVLAEAADRVIVEHDALVALLGASLGELPAVLVIAGTGSIAFAYDGRRRVIQGDHGWLLGDDGSGFRVAAEALRATLACMQGRGKCSCLEEGLASRLRAATPDDLAYLWATSMRSVDEVARLAAEVCSLAEWGCVEAAELLWGEAVKLAGEAARAARAVAAEQVYMIGGLFNCSVFRGAFAGALLGLQLDPREPEAPPTIGALLLAAEAVGAPREAITREEVILEAWRQYR